MSLGTFFSSRENFCILGTNTLYCLPDASCKTVSLLHFFFLIFFFFFFLQLLKGFKSIPIHFLFPGILENSVNALTTFSSSSETLDPGTDFLPFKRVLQICCSGRCFHLPVTDGLLSSLLARG